MQSSGTGQSFASPRRSRQDLVSAIVSGDRSAEAELVDWFARGLAIILSRIVKDHQTVEDLRQDSFRIAIERLRSGALRDPDALPGFMAMIARNVAIEHLRQRTPGALSATAPDPTGGPSQYHDLARKQNAAIVRKILNELPQPRDRELLYRFYIADEEKETICERFGLSALHFNRVLHRARERFRELFEKRRSGGGIVPPLDAPDR
ncbi:MAG: sigma-70 family RNA polymerase sigma factor [Acidobacteria bacterium]|nr:sigma-70 family RNA polymerase sigma factor [Acidobacteriota bacterium]